jgi:drug/metabolite transporter (DMT)-like permease
MQNDRNYDALLWALLHSLAFASATVAIKLLASSVPVLEQIFVRAMIGLLILVPSLRGEIGALTGRNWPLLLLRGVAGFVGVYCMFYTVSRLPLLIAMILTLLTPVFVMVISAVLLHERMSFSKIGYALLTLASVFVVVYPFDQAAPTVVDLPLSAYAVDLGIGMFGSIATAAAFVSMRAALRVSTVKIVVLWFMGCNAILSLLAGGADFIVPTPYGLAILVVLALLGLLSDMFKTRAYKHAMAGIVSVLSLMSIVFAAAFGWLFFAESISLTQVYGVVGLVLGIAFLTAPDRAPKRAL